MCFFTDFVRARKINSVKDLQAFCKGSPKKLWWWMFQYLKYTRDMDNQGVQEYWQTSDETLFLRTGDCEDYSVLAYDVLEDFDRHIIVASKGISRIGHAVCAFTWGGHWYHISNQGLKKTRASNLGEVAATLYKPVRWYETDARGKRIL